MDLNKQHIELELKEIEDKIKILKYELEVATRKYEILSKQLSLIYFVNTGK